MSDEKRKGLALLREPFPAHQISFLPKPFKRDSPKGNCTVCGSYHALPATHLEYVGHAALTYRLLDVDPEWSWEPLALDQDGLPRFDTSGGLWIKLTVCGMTRLGYGHAETSQYKDVGAREKEIIGDALRNAAMRFGAALDLWHKGDLHGHDEEGKRDGPEGLPSPKRGVESNPGGKPKPPTSPGPVPAKDLSGHGDEQPAPKALAPHPDGVGPSEAQIKRLFAIKTKVGWTDGQLKDVIAQCYGISSTKDLHWMQYDQLTKLMELKKTPGQVIERVMSEP